jgi:hypothetical protein
VLVVKPQVRSESSGGRGESNWRRDFLNTSFERTWNR